MRLIGRISIVSISLVLIGTSHLSVIAIEDEVSRVIDEQPSYVLDSRAIRFASLGFDALAADIVWMRTVQYLGSHYKDDRYPQLSQFLNAVVELDPKFQGAYRTGLLLLPDIDRVDEAIALGLRGMAALPADPELPYYLAYDYYQYQQNFAEAARWFTYAAELPGALPSSRTLAATNLAKAGQYEIARQIWQDVYETSADDTLRASAMIKLERIRNLEDIANALEAYREVHNTAPDSLTTLVTMGFLEAIPTDPINTQEYFYNTQTGLPDIRYQTNS